MRFLIRGPVVLVAVGVTVGAGAMAMGAEPVAPRAFPPLPVPPVERQPMPPFLARITISGDTRMAGVFEECVDPNARRKPVEARAKAGSADAPPSTTGCASSHEMQPNGSIHGEVSCDPDKGATASFRMVSDGTPSDLRTHVERHESDATTGAARTTVVDSHLVRLGPCPADLKPGQMRRPGGPVLDPSQVKALRDGSGAPQAL